MGRSLKAHFRRYQIASLIRGFDDHQRSSPLAKLKADNCTKQDNAILWAKMALDDVPENVVRRCWIKAAVLPATSVAYIN